MRFHDKIFWVLTILSITSVLAWTLSMLTDLNSLNIIAGLFVCTMLVIFIIYFRKRWITNICDPNYVPIRDEYCGNSDILPPGYIRFGSRHRCLQKGVRIGQCSRFR